MNAVEQLFRRMFDHDMELSTACKGTLCRGTGAGKVLVAKGGVKVLHGDREHEEPRIPPILFETGPGSCPGDVSLIYIFNS